MNRIPIKDKSHKIGFVRNGGTIMPAVNHVNFVVREFYVKLHESLIHFPSEYQAKIDMKTFMSSVSFIDPNTGLHCSPDNWALAPGQSVEIDKQRMEIRDRLRRRFDRHCSILPDLIPANIAEIVQIPKELGGEFLVLL